MHAQHLGPIDDPRHLKQIEAGHALATGWLGRAIVSGFVATMAMLFFFLVAYGVAWLISTLPLDQSRGLGRQVGVWLYQLTHNHLIDAGAGNAYIAVGLHVVAGLIWAALYAALAEPHLPGPGWARGALFSIVPGILSLVVFLPLVGGGMVGLALGAGPLPIVGNMLLHLVYGATLGALYGPFGDRDASTFGLDTTAPYSSDGMVARGLVLGLVLGAILGIAVALFTNLRPDDELLGEPAVAVVLVTALIGAALGGVVGSFLGLSVRAE
jgi:hypothetical protein